MIRARLRTELGLPASVGIAASKFVAKVASTRAKPDGMLVIRPEQTLSYLHTLPVGALWGVGAKTAAVLREMGITTVAQLAQTPQNTLSRRLGATGVAPARPGLGPRRPGGRNRTRGKKHRRRGDLRR